MFDSFSTLLTSIWNSLDDVLICVCLFALAMKVSRMLYWCTEEYFSPKRVRGRSCFCIMDWYSYCVSVFPFNWRTVAVSLFSGFSIGIGYAMQPYITSVVSSAAMKAMFKLERGDTLRMNDIDYEVHHVGLLYVCTKHDKYWTYFPVTRFLSTPFSVHKIRDLVSSY